MTPPRFFESVLRRVLPEGVIGSTIVGDLHEEYVQRAREQGRRRAGLWYRRNVVAIALRYLVVPRRPKGRRRRLRRGGHMDSLRQDLRFALRDLLAAPMYTVASVATLALGVASVTLMFSITDGVLLRPLPYPSSERIVSISEDDPGIDMPVGWTSIPNYLDWKEQTTVFESVALFRGRSMSFTGDGAPEYAYGAYVTSEFFSTFGVAPRLGRGIEPEENVPGNDRVVVLGYGSWRTRFGADPDIVGTDVEVDGQRRTVVGVMPQDFGAPVEWISPQLTMALWIPFAIDPESARDGRDNRSYNAVARLRSGVTLEEARAEIETVHARLREAYPLPNGAWYVQLFPWQELVVGGVRPAILLLLGAAFFLLLIACANVASLKLHRMLSREGELTLRAALGAGRGRILRQLLTEGLVLGGVGAVLATGLATGGVEVLSTLNPGDIPRWNDVGIDARAVGVTFALTMVSILLSGLIPALKTARSAIAPVLRQSSAFSSSRRRFRAQGVVVTVQVALSVALLVGATLMTRSFSRLVSVPSGLNPASLLTATVVLSWNRVDTIEARADFVRRALLELRALPGVESAAMINSLPFSGSNAVMPFTVFGRPIRDESAPPAAAFRGISRDYFSTMGIPLLSGRDFTERDIVQPQNVLINDRMARAHFAGTNAVGQQLAVWNPDVPEEDVEWWTIVGIVSNVRHYGLDRETLPEVYLPYSAEYLSSKTFVLKTSVDPELLTSGVRERLAEVDSLQPVRDIRPMTAYLANSVAQPRFNMALVGATSLVAIALATVGLFGVIACATKQRSREFGLRMALGAERAGVLRLVLKRGLALGAVGIVIGILLALGLSGFLEHLLFGIDATDPVTLGGVAVGFIVLCLAASLYPAIDATRVDPMHVLRVE